MASINILISYSRLDSDFVSKLSADLRKHNFNTWVDTSGIALGKHWDKEIENAIFNADVIVAAVSRNFIASENTMNEIDLGLNEKKTIIPVLLEKCELPLILRRLQAVKFYLDYDAAFNELVSTLTKKASEPGIKNDSSSTGSKGSGKSSSKKEMYWLITAGISVVLIIALQLILLNKKSGDEHTNINPRFSKQIDDPISRGKEKPAIADIFNLVYPHEINSGRKDAFGPALFSQLQVDKFLRGSSKEMLLTNGDTIRKKDKYRVLIFPASTMFIYVLQIDSRGNLNWLFPQNSSDKFSRGSNPVAGNNLLYLPSDNNWWTLDDNIGNERVYVIGSNKRWLALEAKLQLILAAQANGSINADPFKLRGVGGITNTTKVKTKNANKITTMFQGLDSTVVIENWFYHGE